MPSADPRPAAPAGDGAPAWARILVLLGVATTVVSFAALLVILGFYFAGADAHPVFYFTALWGFPVGFTLMCVHVLASGRRRRRRLAS